MSSPTEGRVRAGELELRYRSWGDPDAPPLVLLHGRTSLLSTWDEVAAELSRDHRVLALQQRGHGESSWSPTASYHLIDFLTDYEQFVEEVVGGPHVLIGHSMGACTSLVYAARHPEKVRALVLEDGGPPGATVMAAVRSMAAAMPVSFPDREAVLDFLQRIFPRVPADRHHEQLDEHVVTDPDGALTWRSDVPGLLSPSHTDGDDELFFTGQWDAVRTLTTPTLFCVATEEPRLMGEDTCAQITALNDLITRVDFASGHAIHEERFNEFVAAVRDFLPRAGQPSQHVMPSG